MAIKYEAYTRLGEKVTGVLDTDSEEAAYNLLEQDDLIPYRVRPVRQSRSLAQVMPSLFQPRSGDVVDFIRQLASLLNSGIPLRRALTVQRDEARSLGLKEALRRVLQDIEAGSRFSDALSRHPGVFPDLLLRLLKVGEATGTIPDTLKQVAADMQRRRAITDRVKKALTYPAISLGLALVATIVLVTYSLPSLTGLLKEFGGEMPTATRALIALSDVLRDYGLYIIGPVIGAAVMVVLAMRVPLVGAARDQFLLHVPVVGTVLTASNMFYLTNSLSTLLGAGVPPIEALRLSGSGLGNAVFRLALRRVTSKTTEGMRLGQAFSEEKVFPSIIAQAVVTGETGGSLADTLGGLAVYYEERTERTVSGALELLQPMVIIIVASIVGFVAIAVISGIYSTIGSVK